MSEFEMLEMLKSERNLKAVTPEAPNDLTFPNTNTQNADEIIRHSPTLKGAIKRGISLWENSSNLENCLYIEIKNFLELQIEVEKKLSDPITVKHLDLFLKALIGK